MKQSDRRKYLIEKLLKEQPRYSKMRIPSEENEQRTLLRSLMNIRMPGFISEDFLQIQDEYFAEIRKEKGMITLSDMEEVKPGIYIWQGDIKDWK